MTQDERASIQWDKRRALAYLDKATKLIKQNDFRHGYAELAYVEESLEKAMAVAKKHTRQELKVLRGTLKRRRDFSTVIRKRKDGVTQKYHKKKETPHWMFR